MQDTNQGQPKEDTQVRATAPKGRAFVSLGHFILPAHQCITSQEACLTFQLQDPEFLLRFHYGSIVEWIIGHVIELNF